MENEREKIDAGFELWIRRMIQAWLETKPEKPDLYTWIYFGGAKYEVEIRRREKE